MALAASQAWHKPCLRERAKICEKEHGKRITCMRCTALRTRRDRGMARPRLIATCTPGKGDRTGPVSWLVCHGMILIPSLRAVGRINLQYPARQIIPSLRTRSLFSLFRKAPSKPESQPTLSQDNLFHPFSKSPFPAIVARGEAIRSLAPCPVCAPHHDYIHDQTKAQPREVAFECPDCGWPTHCTEEHWHADQDHAKYCSRLREVNEDEHDLRSGRRLREFELPGTLGLHVRAQPHDLPSRKCRSAGHGSCHLLC
jgi:Zinc-finger of mitochondrial splicing suppressor 51